MTRFQERRLEILMTGRARGRAHINTAQVAHPGPDACVVAPLLSCVSAQPSARRAVAGLAGNAFVRMRFRAKPARRDRLERRMANRAACTCFGRRNSEAFCDPLGTRGQQDRETFRVKIFLAPGEILAALRSSATVAAGRFTADGADECPACFLS